MSWDNNVFYSPEKFGLEIVETIDFSDGYYQFDYLVVFKSEDGRWFYAEDSGCSCPSPFEGMGMPDLTRVEGPEDIISRMEFRIKDSYYDEKYGQSEVDDFKSKVKRGEFA